MKENQDQLFTQGDMNERIQALVDANPGLVPAYLAQAYYGGQNVGQRWMETLTLDLPPDTIVETTQTYEVNSGNDVLVFTDGITVEDIRVQFAYGQNPLGLTNAQLGDHNGNGIFFEDYNGDGQIDELPTYPIGWADFWTTSLDLYIGIADDTMPDAMASELEHHIRIESFVDFFDHSASGAGGFWNADGERAIETFIFDDGLEVDVSDMKFWDAWSPGLTSLFFDAAAYAAVYQYNVNVANEWIGGTSGNDIVFALGGNDLVMGRGGDDFLYGGAGNDRLYGGEGNDSLWGEDGDDYLSGGAGNDVLVGHAGNDILDGGTGADEMRGGAGNDSYVVDNVGDIVIEEVGEGVDTVKTSIDYALTANVENLIATGIGNLTLTGNSEDNEIRGNAGNNIIFGGAGNDRIAGDIGHDVIDGGEGIDTAVYAGARAGYHISRTETGWRVEDIDLFDGVYEGVDLLTNIEFLEFSDVTIDLSTFNGNPVAAPDYLVGYQNQSLVISAAELLA
ncbi:MAG: calcium-binding protein, partial [Alphaproteobacteria bacterium]|nr:calcium-binding protein [Alphaproteobacteria bacterium]